MKKIYMLLKTIYMLWCIVVRGTSVIRMDGERGIYWGAHDKPQDGYGGHNGRWREGATPQEAVWNLYWGE